MTERDFELTRRRVLGALGTIGVASAGAGLGTSAYFSDQETFQNNRLVAGEVDLKTDWEEHYSNWSADESTGLADDVLMEPPENPDEYTRFPAGAIARTLGDHGLWVNNRDVPQFMDNTSLEAFPDVDNDRIAEFPVDQRACETLADVGGDDGGLDPSAGARSDNEDTRLENGDPAPLINLDDIKPGDFGEITFSVHPCGNDAYLWLNSPDGITAHENGVTEPEADDPQEDQQQDGTLKQGQQGPASVELPEVIQTAFWYDNNCDNLVQQDCEPMDIMALIDTSGSIESSDMSQIVNASNLFMELLPPGDLVHGGILTFGGFSDDQVDQVRLEHELAPPSTYLDNQGNGRVEDFVPDQGWGEYTPIPAALDIARHILNDRGRSTYNGDPVRKAIVVITDGAPNYPSLGTAPKTYSVDYPTGGGSTTISSDPLGNPPIGDDILDETADMARDIDTGDRGFTGDDGIEILSVGIDASQFSDTFLETRLSSSVDNYFDGTFTEQSLEEITEEILVKLGICPNSDEVFFRGTLSEAMEQLTSGNGIALDGNRGTSFNEANGLVDDPDTNVDPSNDPNREHFIGETTHCFGFSWWLPLDHGNQIQTDSIQFDLGFYAEQSRHNDGAGMNNDAVDPDEVDA